MKTMRRFSFASLAFTLILSESRGQVYRDIYDGTVPPGVAPGAPAGSYPLSGFATINHFSGNLNLAIPLLSVGGRGEATHTMAFPVWSRWSADIQPGPGVSDPPRYTLQHNMPTSPFGTGRLSAYQEINPDTCTTNPTNGRQITLLRLKWESPDGSQMELLDEPTKGAPQLIVCNGNYTRGRRFVSTDGSATTFVADFDFKDRDPVGGAFVHSLRLRGTNSATVVLPNTAPFVNLAGWSVSLKLHQYGQTNPATQRVLTLPNGPNLDLLTATNQLALVNGGSSCAVSLGSPTDALSGVTIRVRTTATSYSIEALNASGQLIQFNDAGCGTRPNPVGLQGSWTIGANSGGYVGSIGYLDIRSTPAVPPNSTEARAASWSFDDPSAPGIGFQGPNADPAPGFVFSGSPVPEITLEPGGLDGYLYLKDGTTIRIMGGLPAWKADRNGNRLTFEYDLRARVRSIVDSIGRVTTLTHTDSQSTITFAGTGTPSSRTVRVFYEQVAACTGKPLAELFPGFTEGTWNNWSFDRRCVLLKIELPNLETYTVQFNDYGEVRSVTLPTGGRYEYDWMNGHNGTDIGGYSSVFDNPTAYRRVKESRRYNGASLVGRSTYSRPDPASVTPMVEVVHFDGATELGKERHYFHGPILAPSSFVAFGYPDWKEGREYRTEWLNGTTVIKSTEETWARRNPVTNVSEIPPTRQNPSDARSLETRTTLDGVAGAKVTRVFSLDAFNNVTETCDFDFGGIRKRCLTTEYETSPLYTADPVHLRGLPKSETVKRDDAGSLVTESVTTRSYDGYGAGDVPALMDRVLMVQHGTTAELPNAAGALTRGTGWTLRGNMTAITKGSLATTHYGYDIAGNTVFVKGPAVKTSAGMERPVATVDYTDQFTPGTPSPGATFAFATQVNSPMGLSSKSKYDYALGRITEFEDPNGKKTLYSYGRMASSPWQDPLDRLTKVTHPIGTTAFEYPSPTLVRTRKSVTSAMETVSEVIYDGLGRATRSNVTHPDCGGNLSVTETLYDALERADRVSNPGCGAPAPAKTTTTFDFLGRVLDVTHQDNSVTRTRYSAFGTRTRTLTRDAGGKWAARDSDGLGRLVAVTEDATGTIGTDSNAGANILTSYVYDARDNLTYVEQAGRDRVFRYDSLGRLKEAENPELGTEQQPRNKIIYDYDEAGNLISRIDPRGASMSVVYDLRGRPVSKSYTGVAAPAVSYCYDGIVTGACTGAPSDPGNTKNLKGRLTYVSNGAVDPENWTTGDRRLKW